MVILTAGLVLNYITQKKKPRKGVKSKES